MVFLLETLGKVKVILTGHELCRAVMRKYYWPTNLVSIMAPPIMKLKVWHQGVTAWLFQRVLIFRNHVLPVSSRGLPLWYACPQISSHIELVPTVQTQFKLPVSLKALLSNTVFVGHQIEVSRLRWHCSHIFIQNPLPNRVRNQVTMSTWYSSINLQNSTVLGIQHKSTKMKCSASFPSASYPWKMLFTVTTVLLCVVLVVSEIWNLKYYLVS